MRYHASMRYHAIYRDDRDHDMSAIAECASVYLASVAIVMFFKRRPENLARCAEWQIIDANDGDRVVASGIVPVIVPE